jgi:hypothetical protein
MKVVIQASKLANSDLLVPVAEVSSWATALETTAMQSKPINVIVNQFMDGSSVEQHAGVGKVKVRSDKGARTAKVSQNKDRNAILAEPGWTISMAAIRCSSRQISLVCLRFLPDGPDAGLAKLGLQRRNPLFCA